MRNTNLKGTRKSYSDPWKAYDQLPPTAKRALQDAQFNWAASYFARHWKIGTKGFKTGSDIAAQVVDADRRQHMADVKRGIVAP